MLTDNATNSANWLKKNCEPWNAVIENWKNSFLLRRNDKSVTVGEYLQKWPILKHRNAEELVNKIVIKVKLNFILKILSYFRLIMTSKDYFLIALIYKKIIMFGTLFLKI